MKNVYILTIAIALATSCSTPSNRFERIPASQSGIDFNNLIIENDSFNILNNEYMYNGGGVGIGDLNNDGLQDVVFSGNKTQSKIYLNKGDFQFEDISEQLIGLDNNQWYSGVVLADINGDRFLDIYLTSTLNDDSLLRKNKAWINQGLDAQGIPSFIESSDALGIADMGYSMHASFFDYDLDGDLDLYILNNIVNDQIPTNYRPKIADGSAVNNDKFYRNDGEIFIDITIEAGITYEGYGLGLAVGDINKDGYPDIYISNDYISNDILYINQKNGSFRNESEDYLSYHSKFSMGNDIADYNNDGYLDIISLDMLPEDYFRKKQTIAGATYIFYINDQKYGYQHQYVRNMLHTHNGFYGDQMMPFSELGQLMGIHETEWSWSPLFADFDNDGDKDLFITNGFPKDLTDKDFTNYKAQMQGYLATDRQIIAKIPVVKVSNYAYENLGDLNFDDKTSDWGLEVPSFSNGAAFADLDNDGDLDYIVNNINDQAFVYRNNSSNQETNYLRVKPIGEGRNTNAIGAKIELWTTGGYQYQEQFLNRGYLSTVEPYAHFGLGNTQKIDSLKITWPTGKITTLKEVQLNQILEVNESEALDQVDNGTGPMESLFANKEGVIDYIHSEQEYIDFFQYQHTVSHKFSQIGPCIAQGDFNQDGINDLIIGGTQVLPTTVLVREGDSFVSQEFPGLTETRDCQEADIIVTDLEGDGDNDVVSLAGGYINDEENTYTHKVFINENGSFTERVLPILAFPASVVIAFDFDKDGDEDIFAGSRVKKNFFPYAHPSLLLVNQDGELTSQDNMSFDLGMVTDATVSDFNGDGWEDIIIAREWNSITILINESGKSFSTLESETLNQYKGFWTSVAAGDLDGDGDDDYILGNLGDNHRFNVSETYPMRLYAIDIDNNGVIDPLISSYWEDREGMMQEFPIHFFDELASQSPYYRKRFQSYTDFSNTNISETINLEVVGDELIFLVNNTSSYILWNEDGNLEWDKLPRELQVSPIQEMIIKDFNGDQIVDVMVTGNDYTYDVPTGYYDANKGLMLIGKGDRKFEVLSSAQTGLLLKGQVESLLYLEGDNPLVVAGINRGPVAVYEHNIK